MNSEINQIMSNRQNRFDERSRRQQEGGMPPMMMGRMPPQMREQIQRNQRNPRNQRNQRNNEVNDLRNDNDLEMRDRLNMLNQDNEFMSKFDESYYLENISNNKITRINSEGKVMDNEENDPVKASLKKKALDLETLIVERLARDKYNDANRIFSVLKKMYNKFDDDNVKDIYFRVLQSLPKQMFESREIYSYRQDKNNFKNVLNEMKNNKDIKAFNEENPCISSLGEMWEACDLDICSKKCKDKILDAKNNSTKEDCKQVVTGYDNDKNSNLTMEDDIKSVILDRLNYCKRIAE